ncbi:UNVERIFIED_CONTAM: hypothetical protein HDU68_007643 [Siphonaria sp. JEL0065]|nr:hypothetical protein HDU68_007643 [Siphonaria sp. JEL0065]
MGSSTNTSILGSKPHLNPTMNLSTAVIKTVAPLWTADLTLLPHDNKKKEGHKKEAQIVLSPVEAAEVQAAALTIMARLACDFEAAHYSGASVVSTAAATSGKAANAENKAHKHDNHNHNHHRHGHGHKQHDSKKEKENHKKEAQISLGPVEAAEVHAAALAIVSRHACDVEAAHYSVIPVATAIAAFNVKGHQNNDHHKIHKHDNHKNSEKKEVQDFTHCTGAYSAIGSNNVKAELYAGKLVIAAKMGSHIEGHWKLTLPKRKDFGSPYVNVYQRPTPPNIWLNKMKRLTEVIVIRGSLETEVTTTAFGFWKDSNTYWNCKNG